MHFYYLDEAGSTGTDLANTQQPVFVLGGLSVRDEGWNVTQEALDEVLTAYFQGRKPDGFELHAEQLLSPEGQGPFLGHDRARRNELALNILALLTDRHHDVHLFAIDKAKLAAIAAVPDGCEPAPYTIAYDYMITYINWYVKAKLGISARGMLIIDTIDEFRNAIERISVARRFEGTIAHRIKWIVEFSYPVDSRKNPMIQMSDLIVFTAKKFLEVQGGYRDGYPQEAKRFYAECYGLIDSRIKHKTIVPRNGRGSEVVNSFLQTIRAEPGAQWRREYGLS
ncbi:MAG: DUF3800 domain-containing protein [Planctomycetaceae bacterium]|nr:DUF3800 domain-containing protein [Planctomycetaceae bacterium]